MEGLRFRFSILRRVYHQTHAPKDGIMMDLGVSSPQLDDRARGFSVTQERCRGRDSVGSQLARPSRPE